MGIEDPEMAHRDPNPIPEETTTTTTTTPSNPLLTNKRFCFCFPCFYSRRSSSPWWSKIQHGGGGGGGGEDHRWWARGIRALKKIREWSEIVAGPKWKTFIRRFNRNRGHSRHGKFQYDPLSYALNFDKGQIGNSDDEDDDYGGFRDFSSRYALVSGSGRPLTMDSRVVVNVNNNNNRDAAAVV